MLPFRGEHLVILLAGCVPPSTIGLQTDGLTPNASGVEGVLYAGGGTWWEGESDGSYESAGAIAVGAGGTFALSRKTALHVTGLAFHYDLEGDLDGEGGTHYVELVGPGAEIRFRLLEEQRHPLNLTLLGGAAVTDWIFGAGGVHAGFVLSRHLRRELRLYIGPKFNLGLGYEANSWLELLGWGDQFLMFGHLTAGATWRPALGSSSGLLGIEATCVMLFQDPEARTGCGPIVYIGFTGAGKPKD
jgi:hypothetical protein